MEQMKKIGEVQEEKGVKAWVKKNRVNITLGLVSVAGLCISRYAYKAGYKKGHLIGNVAGYDEGFKDACNFNEDTYNKIVETTNL